MPIQLIIRPYDDSADVAFAPGEAFTGDGDRVRVGSAPDCDCRIPPVAGQPGEIAVLTRNRDGHDWTLEPTSGSDLRRDDTRITGPVPLRSGDYFRCGDRLIVFHKLHAHAEHSRWADGLAIFAKVLIAIILVGEALAVAWLPQRVNQAARWEKEIARHRATCLLDDLRATNARTQTRTEPETIARQYIDTQLNALARYLRAHQEDLARDQWRRLQADIERYGKIIDNLNRGVVLEPLPRIDGAAAFAAVRKKSVPER